MDYKFDWVIAELKNPSRWWHFCATITFGVIGVISKVVIKILNKTKVYNREILIKLIDDRPKGTPIITVANHHSCIDDPALWSVLRFGQICNLKVMRWSLAAHDICFTQKSHSLFCMYGKCIPVVRGAGVYQPAVDLCIDKLKLGDWVHVFPEGKVNMTKESLRLKWGVGRMIYESPVLPIVVPLWHIGMEEVLPNYPPYNIKWGKRVTINFGNPIDLSETMAFIKNSKVDAQEARRLINNKIQDELFILRDHTELLHQKTK